MKRTAHVLCLAAIMAVAGCNRSTTNAAASDNTHSANASAPAPASPATVDTALLTAHPWALELMCQRDPMTFSPDGRLTAVDGETWRWTLNGDELTLTNDRGSNSVFTVRRSGENLVMTGTPNGGTMVYSPCRPN